MTVIRNTRQGQRSCKKVISAIPKIARKPRTNPKKLRQKNAMNVLMNKILTELTVKERHRLSTFLRNCSITKKQALSKRKHFRKGRSTASESSDSQIQNIDPSPKRKNLKKQKKRLPEKSEQKRNRIPKKEEIVKNIKMIKWDEKKTAIEYELRIREAIDTDPYLSGYYSRNFESTIDLDLMKKMANVNFTHFRRESKKGEFEEKDIEFNSELMKYINNVYMPPKNRVEIIGERTSYWDTNTKVFSDLKNETTGNIHLPSTCFYEYANRNVYNLDRYESLKKFTEEAEKPKNIIKCECCEGGLIKKCWENKECPCYKANMKLRKLQTKNEKTKPHQMTNVNTFDPINVRVENHYFDTIGFACSEECGCGGKCTNNATFLVEKDISQLEVFRKDANMGFGLRSNTAIPNGTAFLEFTGEFCGKVNDKDNDYAFAITTKEDNFYETFDDENAWAWTGWSKAFKKEMIAQLKEVWYINPKKIGNVARTCCHSCEPNLAVVRVFQKGFSPAHCRLLLVTQGVIFPGAELTFDYGPGYVADTLKTICLCKKATCSSSKIYKSLENTPIKQLEEFQALRYYYEFQQFKKDVLDPIVKKFPSKGPSTSSV